jgi:hypothetical protein
MKKKYLQLLGVSVLPLVRRSHYGASECDRTGQLNYLQGDERLKYGRRVVDERVKEQLRDNKEQKWQVWSIHADGTFTLLSDLGYEQSNVKRNDFRVIN